MSLPVTEVEQSALDKLYPSMKAQAPATTKPGSSFLRSPSASPAPSQPVQTEAQKFVSEAREAGKFSQLSDEQLGAAKYPNGGDAGDALPSYDHMLGQIFDPLETHHRGIGDDEGVRIAAETRAATNAAFVEYSIGRSEAQRILTAFNDSLKNPRDAESLERLNEVTYSTLKSQLGTRTDAYLAGAKRIANELSAKIPGFRDTLQAGAGSDLNVIKALANAARRKGYLP